MEQTKEKQIFEQTPVPKAVFTLAVLTVISHLIALGMYRKQQRTHLITPNGMEVAHEHI